MGASTREAVPYWRDLAIIRLADALSRERSLDPEESLILERAVGRRHIPMTRRWLPSDDAKLAKLRLTRMRVPEIAAALERTPWAVYRRIGILKKGKGNG